MDVGSDPDRPGSYVSTGHLPPPDRVAALVEAAYGKFKSNREGQRSSVYPSLAAVREDLFGICVAGTGGRLYVTGDAEYEFPIMSVSSLLCSPWCAKLSALRQRETGSGSMRPDFRSIRWMLSN